MIAKGTILHLAYAYFPDRVGGTEIYLRSLAGRLTQQGWKNVIAAPGRDAGESIQEGLQVRRFVPVSGGDALEDIYGGAQAGEDFIHWLEALRPDLVHLHAVTGVTASIAAQAKRLDARLVLTYHTPAASCAQGSLLFGNESVCDGRLDPLRCAQCLLRCGGVPAPFDRFLSRLPPALGRALALRPLPARARTALRLSGLLRRRIETFRRVAAWADRIVAPCAWVEELLRLNGVPAARLVSCRQGIEGAEPRAAGGPRPQEGPLRVMALGRSDPSKGFDVLVKALRRIPEAALALDFYGLDGGPYAAGLRRLAQGDQRIRFRETIAPGQVLRAMREYDLIAVPSRGMETGPLVVLEAFAAGVPVLGSKRGGIAELVPPARGGWVVAPGSPEAWAEALDRLARDRSLLQEAQQGLPTPRSMETVASEMNLLYESLLAGRTL